MAHRLKLFENPFQKASIGHRLLCRGHIGEYQTLEVDEMSSRIPDKETHALPGRLSPLFCSHLADRAKNFLNFVAP